MSLAIDSFLTINAPSEGEYKEKGSKFLAYAYPMSNESDLENFISTLKDTHPKARHHCYAYKIGMDNNRFRTNDDGEPSGTAGKPILGQIQSFRLTNVCIIVIRYFGGTKLGASGLIHAYKEAARYSLENAELVEKFLFVTYHLEFGYEDMGHILNVIKDLDIEISEKVFDANCEVKIQLRLSEEYTTMLQLKARLLYKSLEEVNYETVIPFCKVNKLSK